ncbi:hypothetical protein ROZALSC1DRAFT_25794 [Rozella allomycis CSF55]|uniref:Uncharacterized protein n=1 Tax=Rozella allomycis (strain CSF55) TaxID=988480 RepID=A0A4P9Y9V6_ROZAC|nr:hypothetical protein ROZALSC1DRAFT_25794 [Rozella allomycis CSF55]
MINPCQMPIRRSPAPSNHNHSNTRTLNRGCSDTPVDQGYDLILRQIFLEGFMNVVLQNSFSTKVDEIFRVEKKQTKFFLKKIRNRKTYRALKPNYDLVELVRFEDAI